MTSMTLLLALALAGAPGHTPTHPASPLTPLEDAGLRAGSAEQPAWRATRVDPSSALQAG